MTRFTPRSKINPRIIFKIVEDGSQILVVGANNCDIIEVLGSKKCNITECGSDRLEDIMELLGKNKGKNFDCIVINVEASRVPQLHKLIEAVKDCAHKIVLRVRNRRNIVQRKRVSKKKELCELIKKHELKIKHRFYCRKNDIYRSPIMAAFSYYTVFVLRTGNPTAA